MRETREGLGIKGYGITQCMEIDTKPKVPEDTEVV